MLQRFHYRCTAVGDLTVCDEIALAEIDAAEPSSAVELISVLIADDLEAS